MKLTKSKLKQIIKEELQEVYGEPQQAWSSKEEAPPMPEGEPTLADALNWGKDEGQWPIKMGHGASNRTGVYQLPLKAYTGGGGDAEYAVLLTKAQLKELEGLAGSPKPESDLGGTKFELEPGMEIEYS